MTDLWNALVGLILWVLSLPTPDNLRALVEGAGHPIVPYLVLFGIVFCETGLLVGFFLPGDSLLFSIGFLCSAGVFDGTIMLIGLTTAAIVGDAVNYRFGRVTGRAVFEKGRLRWVKHEHLIAAKEFYERHGAVAIVLARFLPIVRTFTPFVAGVTGMSYKQFAFYNVAGAVLWVGLLTGGGWLLGNIPVVRDNFEYAIWTVIIVSTLPAVIGGLRAMFRKVFGRAAADKAGDRDGIGAAPAKPPAERD